MSTVNSTLIERLGIATYWINEIYPLFQIILGTFGNLFNIIIFTRRDLRNNPCSLYFLIGSINNCFVIDFGLLTRYLASTWNWDPSTTNNIFCKIRNLFVYAPLTLSLWFVVLASFDRFLTSSPIVRLRQLSHLSVARKAIITTTLLIFLSYSHVPIYFKTVLTPKGMNCLFSPYEYILFLSFFGPILSCILPIMLMSIFGILTIVNVRSIRGQTDVNGNSTRIQRLRSHDRQLSIMLLFQVIITIVISIPYFALAIYNAIAIVMFQYNFSSSEMAIYNFAYNLFRLLYFTNPVLTFYIYTMTGPKFRNEMKRCVRYGLKTIIGILGLRRCLPLRAQQILFGENQNIQTNNVLLSRTKKRDNIIVPI